jgi:hypothetical protein
MNFPAEKRRQMHSVLLTLFESPILRPGVSGLKAMLSLFRFVQLCSSLLRIKKNLWRNFTLAVSVSLFRGKNKIESNTNRNRHESEPKANHR